MKPLTAVQLGTVIGLNWVFRMANKIIDNLIKYGARKFVQPTLSANGSYGDEFWVFRKGWASPGYGVDAYGITDKNTSTFWIGSDWLS